MAVELHDFTQSDLPFETLIGCAGWNIPADQKDHFPALGTHLERYASCFRSVEINSSFYRPHRAATYARWADAVPSDFRFAVKTPKTITHIARLENVEDLLLKFLDETSGLGAKLGCLLVQLPPSLSFEPKVARKFFEYLRAKTPVSIALEPRHATWFEASVELLHETFHISRVAADPSPVPAAIEPSAWRSTVYYRLHGSPRVYYSAYSLDFIRELALELKVTQSPNPPTWCIFDNTALGAAIPNARLLQHELITR